jgi:hypothetical protein
LLFQAMQQQIRPRPSRQRSSWLVNKKPLGALIDHHGTGRCPAGRFSAGDLLLALALALSSAGDLLLALSQRPSFALTNAKAPLCSLEHTLDIPESLQGYRTVLPHQVQLLLELLSLADYVLPKHAMAFRVALNQADCGIGLLKKPPSPFFFLMAPNGLESGWMSLKRPGEPGERPF